MRSAADGGDALIHRRLRHAQSSVHIGRTMVHERQEMRMCVDDVRYRLLTLSLTTRPAKPTMNYIPELFRVDSMWNGAEPSSRKVI
jgi:hypothetical protein